MLNNARTILSRYLKLPVLAALLLVPLLATSASAAAGDRNLTLSGEVVYVFDNDTILLDRKGGGEVRVQLNCPEMKTAKADAKSARAELGRLLLGQQVQVKGDVWEKGVLLGEVFTLDGHRVGERLIGL